MTRLFTKTHSLIAVDPGVWPTTPAPCPPVATNNSYEEISARFCHIFKWCRHTDGVLKSCQSKVPLHPLCARCVLCHSSVSAAVSCWGQTKTSYLWGDAPQIGLLSASADFRLQLMQVFVWWMRRSPPLMGLALHCDYMYIVHVYTDSCNVGPWLVCGCFHLHIFLSWHKH